jgi:hypothetical protein
MIRALDLQFFDAPGESGRKPFVSVLEMIPWIPDQRAVFSSKLSLEKFIFASNAVSNTGNGAVLHVLFLVSQAQIDVICQAYVLLGKRHPVMNPNGRGGGSYGLEGICLHRCPDGE